MNKKNNKSSRAWPPCHSGTSKCSPCDRAFAFSASTLLVLILAAVTGLAPISEARADDVVITGPDVTIIGPIDNSGFVACDCGDGRQTLSNGVEQCASACALLPPMTPISVQDCSGSVSGVPLSSADRFVQCGPGTLFQGGLGTFEQLVLDALVPREESAVDAVLEAHQLPETDRAKVMDNARDSVRAFLFTDLLSTIQKTDSERSIDDQRIVGLYETAVREKRQDAAQFAQSEFNRWDDVVCNNFGTGYVPPLGFTYPSQGAGCTQIGQAFGGPQPPSSAEFIAYGTAHAYNKLNTDAQTAAIAANTAQVMSFEGALAIAAGTGIAAALVVVFSSFGTAIITAIAPFAFVPITGVLSAATTSTIFATSAAALGGAIAVVIAAIAIAVLQGINVFAAAEIPGELQARVDAAQVNPDLRESIKTKEGIQELYGVFIESTMPDFADFSTTPPGPFATKQRFQLKDESGQKVAAFKIIGVQSPALQKDGEPPKEIDAWLNGGWFVNAFFPGNGQPALTSWSLSLPYYDWDGIKRIAWRRGNQFVVTNPNATSVADAGTVADEIKIKWVDGTKFSASIAVDDTPPVVAPQITGTEGNDGWYRSSVSLSWNITDNESDVSSKTGCDAASIDSSGTTSHTCSATSEGGTGTASQTVKVDVTAPTIQGAAAPAANANGWNNAAVTVSFNCSDTPSGVATCSAAQTLSGEGAGQTASGSVTDVAGNSETTTVSSINIDKTAPTITGSHTPAANAEGWSNTNVTVSFDCSDALSGVASCTGTKTLSTDGANQSVSGSATDKAGNTATDDVTGISIDKTVPVVAVTGVTNGAVYTLGAVPAAGCTTSDALSGIKTEAAIAVTGGTADGVGSFTASCAGAMDMAGNSGSSSVTYQVAYPFSTFFQPVDNLPTFNQIKAGAAVGVKFSLGGNFGLDILAAGSPGSQAISCSSSTSVDDIEQTVTAGSSSLTYDAASGQYSYIWKTSSSWSGTCRQLVLTFDDGTLHKANFKFK